MIKFHALPYFLNDVRRKYRWDENWGGGKAFQDERSGRRKSFGKSDPGNIRELWIGLWPINPDDCSYHSSRTLDVEAIFANRLRFASYLITFYWIYFSFFSLFFFVSFYVMLWFLGIFHNSSLLTILFSSLSSKLHNSYEFCFLLLLNSFHITIIVFILLRFKCISLHSDWFLCAQLNPFTGHGCGTTIVR